MYRKLTHVVEGIKTQDGAGVSLTRIIGQPKLPNLDPFLMLDYFGSDNPDEYIAGFPPHPHRGFQTVTYMLKGKMRHRDSVGNNGVIETGGIQWMNAGRGIIHEEIPEQEEGELRGFQLWVNLPAKAKLSPAHYQDMEADQLPVVSTECAEVKILAGSFGNVTSPVNTSHIETQFLDIKLQANQIIEIPCELGKTAFLYCFEGEVRVDGEQVGTGQLGVLENGDTLGRVDL